MPSKLRLQSPSPGRKPKVHDGGNGFLGLVSFSTILPLNIHTSIEEMARYTWLWPLIGAFIGIMVGALAFLLGDLLHLPSLLLAALIYGFALIITGLHHLDGLIDFSDGLMAHGDPRRRIEVMRDNRIGTGGLAAIFLVGLTTVSTLNYLPLAILPLIVILSEISAKLGLITCCALSKASGDGTGTYFIENMNFSLLAVSLLICLLINYFLLKHVGLGALAGGITTGVLMALLARWKFNWTTGDVLGATNEISRMVSLIAMLIVIQTVGI